MHALDSSDPEDHHDSEILLHEQKIPKWKTMAYWREYLAEAMGTFTLTFFGTGAVAGAVLTGDLVGLWQVAVVWGLGAGIAILSTNNFSEAHLNPAISFTMAIFGFYTKFKWRKCFKYWCAQLVGGILAGAVNYALWSPFIRQFEEENNISRGENGSQLSAMMFGEYFPNPALYPPDDSEHNHIIGPARALFVEAIATGILCFMIFAFTDGQHKGIGSGSSPVLIAVTIAALIALFAPMTQCGMNPARDFGPRIVSAFAGWWDIAIPGPKGGFWVYILGPMLGAPAGGALYVFVIRGAVNKSDD